MYAESLGGTIALLIHLRKEGRRGWDGLVLNGAMCGISEKFKPPWPLESMLGVAAWPVPTWQVVPTKGSIPEVSFKEEWKRRLAMAGEPEEEGGQAQGDHGQGAAQDLQGGAWEVRGGDGADVDRARGRGRGVRPCICTEELYRKAKSDDKMIKIYPGMWHQLVGEPQENVERVFGDIVEWLTTRAERARVAAGV